MPPLEICLPGPGPLWPVRKYGYVYIYTYRSCIQYRYTFRLLTSAALYCLWLCTGVHRLLGLYHCSFYQLCQSFFLFYFILSHITVYVKSYTLDCSREVCNTALNVLLYVPCILYSLLSGPTNAQHIYIYIHTIEWSYYMHGTNTIIIVTCCHITTLSVKTSNCGQ